MFGFLFLIFLGLFLHQLSKSKIFKQTGFFFQKMDDMIYGKSNYHQNDFETSILILASTIIKSEGVVNKEGLNYVRDYFIRSYGKEKANESFRKFKTLIVQHISVRETCLEIKDVMPYLKRVQLINFLFEVALADGSVSDTEELEIRKLASYLFIKQWDYLHLRTRYFNRSSTDQNYQSPNYSNNSNYEYEALGLDKNATNEQIKKTYRKLVKQYHPDRLHDATSEELTIAKEKFQKIQTAYESIKDKRGF